MSKQIEWWSYKRDPITRKRLEKVVEYWTVEKIEEGQFQSVFPSFLAHHSQLHTSEVDAWHYIAECMLEDFCTL